MPSPIQITELRLLILSFLDSKSYKACALVCKAWHEGFQPLVWEFLGTPRIENDEALASWQASVEKNALWIRKIDFRYGDFKTDKISAMADTLLANCRSLLSIQVQVLGQTDKWISLVKANPELQELGVRGFRMRAVEQLGEALKEHHQLHSLVLPTVSLPALFAILASCPSLRNLTVYGMEGLAHKEQDPAVETTRTYEIRHFEVTRCNNRSLLSKVLPHFPFLESLTLRKVTRDYKQDLSMVFHKGQLPRLTNLQLEGSDDYDDVVNAIPPGQLRSVSIDDFRSLRQLLQGQGPTLESVRLVNSTHNPTLAATFLECPRLRVLEANHPGYWEYLDIHDLLLKPWVCSDFEALRVPIGVARECTFRVPQVLIEAMAENQQEPNPLPAWRLAENLFVERVRKLSKLRELSFIEDQPHKVLSYETRVALESMLPDNLQSEAKGGFSGFKDMLF